MKLQKPPVIKGLDFSKEKIEEARVNNRLCSVNLMTSNVCNLRCLYCYRDAGEKTASELDFEERKKFLSKRENSELRLSWCRERANR